MKAAIQALRQNPWRSKDREKKSGNMRGDNTPSDVPPSIDEQMEDVAVEDVCMGPVPEDASFISTTSFEVADLALPTDEHDDLNSISLGSAGEHKKVTASPIPGDVSPVFAENERSRIIQWLSQIQEPYDHIPTFLTDDFGDDHGTASDCATAAVDTQSLTLLQKLEMAYLMVNPDSTVVV